MNDLYNLNGGTADQWVQENAQEILKSIQAGLGTGRDYNNQTFGLEGLKAESLDPVVKMLEAKNQSLVFWNSIGKQRITNTVHEYVQLLKYGQDVGLFNLEGETPSYTDQQYRRKSAIVAFMGKSGQVSHPATLAATVDGKNAVARSVENTTQKLLQEINTSLVTADSSKISTAFDGLKRQHMLGVAEISGASVASSESLFDAYFGDTASVFNAKGNILTDALIQDTTNGLVNTRYGEVDRIISNPTVFNDYVKQFQTYKQILVGGVNGVEGANMGQSVASVTTQFGKAVIENDLWFDKKIVKKYNTGASGDQTPAAPTVGVTPIAVVTDVKTSFTGYNGAYWYGVTAKNRYGESAMTLIATASQAVAATESVDLQFTATAGVYSAECFVIYRTEADKASYTIADFHPIFEVAASELATGFDGAAATKVRDRNRFIPNTHIAMVYFKSNELFEYLQFCPTMRMDYAQTSPAYRYSVVNYGTLATYAPGKIGLIWNIGKKTA